MRNPNDFVEYGNVLDWDYFIKHVKPRLRKNVSDIGYECSDTDIGVLIELYLKKNNWKKQYGLVRRSYFDPCPKFTLDDNWYVTSNIYINKEGGSIVLPLFRTKDRRKQKKYVINKEYNKRKNRYYINQTNRVLYTKIDKETKYLTKEIIKYI